MWVNVIGSAPLYLIHIEFINQINVYDSGIQLKALGIVGNIRHCGVFWGLKCNLAGVIVQTALVVALLYLSLTIIFLIPSKEVLTVKHVIFLGMNVF